LATGLGVAAHVGCSAGGSGDGPGDGGSGTGVGGQGQGGGDILGCGSCNDDQYQHCNDSGVFTDLEDCAEQALVCVPNRGCLQCVPGGTACVGNDVYDCTDEGVPGSAFIESCDPSQGLLCDEGECKTECDALEDSPSNVGCEFWAVDLPNERGLNNAAAAPWGVVVSNVGQTTATVNIERNDAPPGQPTQIALETTLTIPSGQLQQVELPRREVTGWTQTTPDPPGPPMTWLSSNAFRITSSAPLVVYQFNVFTNSFANDASLLLPRTGLGSKYRVLGFPTANPITIGPAFAGIPDHTSVTIVGVTGGTNVTVKVSHDIVGDGGSIPAALAGETVTANLGPFDVLNLSNLCAQLVCTGDMTGTIVEATHPVAVFSSGERGIAPITDGPPPPPSYDGDHCCTEHLEEQMFPIESLGTKFVVTRSPVRSSGGYEEPDILRFMGVAATAQVTTNLPAPNDSFSLDPGQLLHTWTQQDFVLETTEPIMIAQYLVSQGFTENGNGDPSQTIFAPIEQYRDHYVFLVPTSWQENWVVLAAPAGGTFQLDGAALPGGCTTHSAGTLEGTDYEAIRCPVTEGPHTLTGDQPFGITVYGYGNVGSYAFVGGADVQKIYDPPPLR
jgi:hypothetical protein